MEKAYKFLAAGLGVGLLIAALGTFIVGPSLFSGEKLDCDTCHEGHGSVVAPDVNPYGVILLTGDTPKDLLIPVSEIFKLPMVNVTTIPAQTDDGKGVPSWGVPVNEFLKAYGVNDFERIIFYAEDLEISVNKTEMVPENVLVPYEFSLRFLGPNVPVSIWIKEVEAIVVVGPSGDSLTLNGKKISYGSMLDGGIDAVLSNERQTFYDYNSREYTFDSGYVLKGIELQDLLFSEGFTGFTKATIKGSQELSLTYDEVLKGKYFITRDKGQIKLALPNQHRIKWVDIESITVE